MISGTRRREPTAARPRTPLASYRIWRVRPCRFAGSARGFRVRWRNAQLARQNDSRAPGLSGCSSAARPTSERPTKRCDLHIEIIVLDHGRRPRSGDDLIARHELPGLRDQHSEHIERARADRHWHQDAALVAPVEAAAAPIEAETLEQESVFDNQRAHGPAPTASVFASLLAQFIGFYGRLIALSRRLRLSFARVQPHRKEPR